jgi:hypothetical protein
MKLYLTVGDNWKDYFSVGLDKVVCVQTLSGGTVKEGTGGLFLITDYYLKISTIRGNSYLSSFDNPGDRDDLLAMLVKEGLPDFPEDLATPVYGNFKRNGGFVQI